MADWWEKALFPAEYYGGKALGWGEAPGGGDIDKGMDYYKQQMQQALAELRSHEATGRGDITGQLTEALKYGAPYREAGGQALQTYMGSLGMGGGGAAKTARESFQESPGYQFALKQGLQSTQRGAAAGGMAGSGAEERELQRVGQGMAQQQYGGWQSKLAGLSGMGQQAAQAAAGERMQAGGELSQLGMGYGGQEAGLLGQLGQAGAEAGMAKGQLTQQNKMAILQMLSQLIGAGGGALLGGL